MQRFGRSDSRWKDRWGGGFVIVTVLALAGAWWLGNWLSDRWASQEPASSGTNPAGSPGGGEMAGMPSAQAPLDTSRRPLTVYFLQAHALKSPEAARRAAADLEQNGLPAAVSHAGEWYKVVVGAYGSRDGAMAAKAEAESAYRGPTKLSLYANPVSIAAEPAVRPQNAAAQAAFDKGLGLLSGYLHEAAAWWDRYATGQATGADRLTQYTSQLQGVADELRPHTSDPVVGSLVAMVEKAVQNGGQIGVLAQGGGEDQYRAAMSGYLALVEQFRSWTSGA
ncbi:SPOR domain-containing protein [Caldinitratiruptor microaerophilus]|uniref:SPOR domain-containing protein n=1 Tax=Caldinitratiruptor microaerophilus TaxID=671077 RepID=A0AA35CN94_9FIRM|nr:SPOR domain-containing protein [Caldinitratiruptor microaerophilus]BDG61513.1 hypothetical protein caldi_26030 [Caldinitratiruptor microaerophilus]